MIRIKYLILLESGEVFDSSERFGADDLPTIEEIEQAFPDVVKQRILAAQPGETIRMTVLPEQCYGFRDEALVFVVPRAKLPSDFNPELGEIFSFNSDDDELIVSVVGLSENDITLDANHPLAGMPVTFEVTREIEQ